MPVKRHLDLVTDPGRYLDCGQNLKATLAKSLYSSFRGIPGFRSERVDTKLGERGP